MAAMIFSSPLPQFGQCRRKDMAVQVVQQSLEQECRRIMSWSGNTGIDPSKCS
jgi:hypothetical protein